MASDEDKKRAQELVVAAVQEYSKAKTEQERRQWVETHLPLLDEAIVLDPENDGAWTGRGTAKHTLGDHEGAITDFNNAIALNSDNATAWNNRGAAKHDLGDYQGAIADFTKAIELNPDHDTAWSSRGSAKNQLGDFHGAIDDYTKAIELNPNNDTAWSSRGSAKSALGDHQGAIDDCTKAIDLNPNNDSAWSNRGAARSELGDHHGAIADHTKAIELNPDNDKAWSNRGVAKSELGDHQGAIADHTKAIELNPKNAAAWGSRGGAKIDLGDYQGAIDDCTKAIELNPNNASAWTNRGSAKYHLGQYQEAITDYKETIRLDPNSKTFSNNLQAAEISKLRHDNAKDTVEIKNESKDRLTEEVKKLKTSIRLFIWLRICLFVVLIVVIFGYYLLEHKNILSLICSSDVCVGISEAIGNNDPENMYAIIARFSTVSLLVFPIIWAIQLINRASSNAHILRFDLFSRLNVENSLDYYSPEIGDKKNTLILNYMDGWMNNNPADRLVSLQKKKLESPSPSPAEEILDPSKALRQLVDEGKPPSPK